MGCWTSGVELWFSVNRPSRSGVTVSNTCLGSAFHLLRTFIGIDTVLWAATSAGVNLTKLEQLLYAV